LLFVINNNSNKYNHIKYLYKKILKGKNNSFNITLPLFGQRLFIFIKPLKIYLMIDKNNFKINKIMNFMIYIKYKY